MRGVKGSVSVDSLPKQKPKLPRDLEGWVMAEHGVPESKWTVIKLDREEVRKSGNKICTARYWECECSCENHTRMVINTRDLLWGRSLSCGCAGEDRAIKSAHKKKKLNVYDLSGEYGIGWATNTNREFYFDLEDYDKIKNYCWYEQRPSPNYIILVANVRDERTKKVKPIKFHQIIGCKGFDHINGNTMDNRKENLRPCEHWQNIGNSTRRKRTKSGYVGVYEQKPCTNKKWVAIIKVKGETIKLGGFPTIEEALIVRLKAEKKYLGEFAPQRHLFAQYGIEDDIKECN